MFLTSTANSHKYFTCTSRVLRTLTRTRGGNVLKTHPAVNYPVWDPVFSWKIMTLDSHMSHIGTLSVWSTRLIDNIYFMRSDELIIIGKTSEALQNDLQMFLLLYSKGCHWIFPRGPLDSRIDIFSVQIASLR